MRGLRLAYKGPNWKRILRNFEGATGCNYQWAHLQSVHVELNKLYQVMCTLRSESGLGWDEQLKLKCNMCLQQAEIC